MINVTEMHVIVRDSLGETRSEHGCDPPSCLSQHGVVLEVKSFILIAARYFQFYQIMSLVNDMHRSWNEDTSGLRVLPHNRLYSLFEPLFCCCCCNFVFF